MLIKVSVAIANGLVPLKIFVLLGSLWRTVLHVCHCNFCEQYIAFVSSPSAHVQISHLNSHFRVTDLENSVASRCLQLHGGWGYMMEYPIARSYVDARVQTIYAGSNEIMKELIARSI